jgi:hypothetical protein
VLLPGVEELPSSHAIRGIRFARRRHSSSYTQLQQRDVTVQQYHELAHDITNSLDVKRLS